MTSLPHALEKNFPLFAQLNANRPAVFLDFDGTLTPIVDHPDQVVLNRELGETLRELARKIPVVILTGRPREKIEKLLPIPGLYFGGSHGFDLRGPGLEKIPEEILPLLPAVGEAVKFFEGKMKNFPQAWVEDKKYTMAIHYRMMDPGLLPALKNLVEEFSRSRPQLKLTSGKRILELRPNVKWDKGFAVLYFLKALGLEGPEVLPIFLGDDETDEDAFRALKNRGWGILVDPGPGKTAARAYLKSPEEAGQFLRKVLRGLA